MTLIEAVKSGRPFRRKGWDWNSPTWVDAFDHPKHFSIQLNGEDILATDYEIQEEKKYYWCIQQFPNEPGVINNGWEVRGVYTEEAIKRMKYEIGKTAIKLEEVK